MHYIDTSVLVTALTAEPETSTACQWLFANQDSAYISDWVLTEFSGALALKLRIGALSDESSRAARLAMTKLVKGSLILLPVTRACFNVAAEFCDSGADLRSGDALHAAIAQAYDLTLASRDRGMVRGARELGLEAVLLEEAS